MDDDDDGKGKTLAECPSCHNRRIVWAWRLANTVGRAYRERCIPCSAADRPVFLVRAADEPVEVQGG